MKKRKILICAIALMAAFQLNNLSSIGPSIGLLQTAFAKSEEHRVKVTVMDYWYTNDLVPIKKQIREEKYYAVGETYIYTDLPLKYSNGTELGTGYVNADQNSYDEHTITEADYKTYKEDGEYIIAFAYQYSEEDYNALMSQNIKDQIVWMDPTDRRTTDTSGYMDDYPKYVQGEAKPTKPSTTTTTTTTTTKTPAVKKVSKNTYKVSTKAVKFKKGATKSVKVSTAQVKAVLKKAKTKSTVKKTVYSIDKKYAKYAKINSKTGKITMLKKGKIVVKATLTLKNGKKIVIQIPVTLK